MLLRLASCHSVCMMVMFGVCTQSRKVTKPHASHSNLDSHCESQSDYSDTVSDSNIHPGFGVSSNILE